MNLLIITQSVDEDDPFLGFFCSWLNSFSARVSTLEVICLHRGRYAPPENVRVYSLGKERGYSRPRIIYNFFRLLPQVLPRIDKVLVHMNSIWVVLGAPFSRKYGKQLFLWYGHPHVPWDLKAAARFTTRIFTPAQDSLNLTTPRKTVTGQGIDLKQFPFAPFDAEFWSGRPFRILSIGRISPIKDYETLLKALSALDEYYGFREWRLRIVGGIPIAHQQAYYEHIKRMADKLKLSSRIEFVDPVPYLAVAEEIRQAHLTVTMLPTAGQKTIWETMAVGRPALISTPVYNAELGADAALIVFAPQDHMSLAQRLFQMRSLSFREAARLSAHLRQLVEKGHNLESLTAKLVELMGN